MSHPTEHLPDLVDGTLPERERAAVLAHVEACARCRAEVEAATAARGALRALEAPPVPEGVGAPAIAEAAREAASRHPEVSALGRDARATQRWARVATGAGIAAVLLLGMAVVLPRIGGDARPALTAAEDAGTQSAGGAAGPAPAAAEVVEVVDEDLGFDGVRELAGTARAAWIAQEDAGFTAGDHPAAPTMRPGAMLSEDELDPATDCLRRAFEGLPGNPRRLIQARFEGTPAFFGVFEVGAGGGQRPDAIRVLVASTDGCVPLHSTSVAV